MIRETDQVAIGSKCVGHYLLWREGIAHNDISLSNLLCTKRNGHIIGILNDFDLAGFMEPGVRNPEKRGWERTGSIAFMAMDLLKHPDGQQKRWYRHDLESFAWCLLWVMMDKPPLSWLDDGFDEVFQQKSSLFNVMLEIMDEIEESEWGFANGFASNWLIGLRESSLARDRNAISLFPGRKGRDKLQTSRVKVRNLEDEKKGDAEHVRRVVELAKTMDYSEDVPALADISWVDVQLE